MPTAFFFIASLLRFRRVPMRLIYGLGLCTTGIMPALACKYTVRDVAFVSFNDQPYQLVVYLDETTTEDEIALLRVAAEQVLDDSNVRLHVNKKASEANAQREPNVDTPGSETLIAAKLIAPDGRERLIAVPTLSETNVVSIRESLLALVNSPLRNSIMRQLLEAHSVVLIVESDDAVQNQRAASLVADAVTRIETSLPDLPKPIDVPPRVVTLSTEQVRTEGVLLWSLGVDLTPNRGTQIAILFGRGRTLGSVMEVAQMQDRDLLRTLAIVGLDCECELDRSWMQAPMIPHQWTEQNEAAAVQSLDFDPGHPLVKVEISRILSRGPNSRASDGKKSSERLAEVDALLPGLQIIELNFEEEELPQEIEVNESPRITTNHPDEAAFPAQELTKTPVSSKNETYNSATGMISTVLLGLACLGVVGGALVLLFGRRGGP